ncbi:MAG: hypothetical protein ABJD82_04175 [Marinobacter sp.]
MPQKLELLYKNNYLREDYHDHLHRELLLGGTAATIVDHLAAIA